MIYIFYKGAGLLLCNSFVILCFLLSFSLSLLCGDIRGHWVTKELPSIL